MKLHATVGDYEGDVDIRIEDTRIFAVVDDRAYELDLQRSVDNQLLLMVAGRVFECRVDGKIDSGLPLDVSFGTGLYAITLTDPRRLRSATAAGALAGGAARIMAPMPGKVVRVLVEAGAQVEAGDGIVVVEAMKMQNEMKSPRAGKVINVNVEVGATVDGGDLLAVIE
jgi:acetyl/propionyl-CoA carboxylase alpha subunit